jgi:hypothetical protein
MLGWARPHKAWDEVQCESQRCTVLRLSLEAVVPGTTFADCNFIDWKTFLRSTKQDETALRN